MAGGIWEGQRKAAAKYKVDDMKRLVQNAVSVSLRVGVVSGGRMEGRASVLLSARSSLPSLARECFSWSCPVATVQGGAGGRGRFGWGSRELRGKLIALSRLVVEKGKVVYVLGSGDW